VIVTVSSCDVLKTRTSEKNGAIPWIEDAAGSVTVVALAAGAAASAAIATSTAMARDENGNLETRVEWEVRMGGLRLLDARNVRA
jgi:hypothetical protein